jgi:hypothetical protein
MESVQLQDQSDKALADELGKRGFTLLQGEPSQAQLRAAIPAALWGDGRVRTHSRCRLLLASFPHSTQAALCCSVLLLQ